MRNALSHGYFGVDFEIVMNTPNSATQYNVMLPPGTVLRFIRIFGEGCVSLGGRVAMVEFRPC